MPAPIWRLNTKSVLIYFVVFLYFLMILASFVLFDLIDMPICLSNYLLRLILLRYLLARVIIAIVEWNSQKVIMADIPFVSSMDRYFLCCQPPK